MYDRLFSRSGLSLERLRSFLAVVEARGIARAAPGSPTRQSQYSRQLAELEGFVGGALFVRRGRAWSLTERGERLAVVAREVFGGLESVLLETAQSPERFELGAGDSLLHWWIVPRLHRVQRAVPGATLSVVAAPSSEVVQRIADARSDVGVARASNASGLQTRALGTVEYALFVPRRLLRGVRQPTLDDALGRAPLVLQQTEPEMNQALERAAGRALPVALECETFPQAARAVRSGEYASLLPTFARAELPVADFLELRPNRLQKLAWKVVLVFHPRVVRQRHRGEALVDALARELQLQR